MCKDPGVGGSIVYSRDQKNACVPGRGESSMWEAGS